MMNKLLFLIFIPFIASAQSDYKPNEILSQLTDDPIFNHAQLGVSLVKIENAELITAYNSDKLFIPASSLKLINNFSALKILGTDYYYQTVIYHSGQISYDGTLTGDLIIKGSGDPSLGSFDFKGVLEFDSLLDLIVQKLQAIGISCIEGSILLDDTVFEKPGAQDSWQWNDVANYYGSGAWGLNVHENLYFIEFDTRGKLGSPAHLTGHKPLVPGLKISSEVTINKSNSGDQAYVFGGPLVYHNTVRGTLAAGKKQFRIKAALPDPGLFFIQKLKSRLAKYHISSGECVRTKIKNDNSLKQIYSHRSPALERIVYLSNLESNNLYSEALVKTVASDAGLDGSDEAGLNMIKQLLKEYGLSIDEYKAVDACGLSRQNYISPGLMTSFISELCNDLGPELICKLLAQPGNKGTAENLFKGKDIRNRIWMKTGSMSSIQSYSGLMLSEAGHWYSFCLIANAFDKPNYIIRSKFEHFLTDICESI